MNPPHHHGGARVAFVLVALGLAGVALAVPRVAGAIEWQPKARLHLDYGANHTDVEPLGSGWYARRADLGLEGKFNDDWSFEIGYGMAKGGDIKPGEGKFKDVTLSWDGWSAGDFTVGQFKVPFGLAEMTSSNDIIFIERALAVDAFAPSRRVGVGFRRNRDAYTFAAMAFGSTLDGDDRGRGLAARLTLAPVRTADTVVHLGVAFASEDPHSKVDFDTTPEARVADVDLVNTGGISDVDRINRLGLEGAWRTGPWSLQAEWLQAEVRRDAGWPDATLDGWYVGGSWVLTGESRPYKNGRFKGIEPGGSRGAWELTARYSRIDLDGGGLAGGTESNVTLGVNYYINKHLRIMLNHISVRSERRGVADDPGIVLLRTQLAW